MKTIKYLLFSVLLVSLFSCDVETENIVTSNAAEGGLLEVPATSQLIPYVLGDNATYTANFVVPISQNPTTSVDVYKQFFGADGSVSNKILFKTVSIDIPQTYSIQFDYTELIDGLEVNGNPLPTSDLNMSIADSWILTYHSLTTDGNDRISPDQSKIAVGTRLAGIYDIEYSEYHHWDGGIYSFAGQGWTRTIESIGLNSVYTIYKYSNTLFDYWSDDNSFFYFYVYNDPIVPGGNEYRLEVPKEYEGELQTIFNDGLELGTCTDLDIYTPPTPFPYTCDDNYVTLNDNGHDVIHIIYGYITSSIRPGYEEDVKK